MEVLDKSQTKLKFQLQVYERVTVACSRDLFEIKYSGEKFDYEKNIICS